MSDYSDYQITLRLRSPLGTPLQSDTLFGHLAWEVRHAEGADGIKQLLEQFQGGKPPFVFSDGFPAGLLPRPMMPMEPEETETPQKYASERRRRKADFVTTDDFQSIIAGGRASEPVAQQPWRAVEVPHAPIQRDTGTVGSDPGLYHTEVLALESGKHVHIYLRCLTDWVERVHHLLQRVCRVGFGKDRSMGCGELELEDIGPCGELFDLQNADGFVSLSSMTPAQEDPTEGYWNARVKYGKLGEQAGGGNPFKRPLVQFEPGAVFRCEDSEPPAVCGRMVKNIAPGMPEAVQCGLALTVPCKWRGL